MMNKVNYMKFLLTRISIPLLLCMQQVEAASVIIDEQFLGNTQAYYEERGWYDGVSSLNHAMILEKDPTLKKQVIYARWVNPNEPSPNGGTAKGSGAWRFMKDRNNVTQGWSQGVSFHAAVKFKNYIDVQAETGHGMFRMIQGAEGQFQPLNSSGQILIDQHRSIGGNLWHLPPPSASQQCKPDGDFTTEWVKSNNNYSIAWMYPEKHILDSCQNGWLHDSVWYEIAGFVFPSVERGQNLNSAKVKLYYRRYGTSSWKKLVDKTKLNIASGVPGVINQLTTNGPYSHDAKTTSPSQRMYLGWLTYYHGDAIADGNIPGFTSVNK